MISESLDKFREETIQVKDHVVLNSGGPVMTVTETDANAVVCEWWDGDKRYGQSFPRATVRKIDKPVPESAAIDLMTKAADPKMPDPPPEGF